MKKIYLAYLLLIILSACGSKNTNSVYLNGEIKGLGNDTLYIYGTDKFYNRMDTLLVKDDKFSATLTTDTLASTWLQFSDGTEYPLYLDKGDNIKIKGSAAELTSLEITGNVPNEELTAFQKELNTLIEQIFSSIEELVDGKLVCGAGGGGFLQVILKKGVTKQMVEERLKEVFMDSLVGVADCKLVWE